VDVHTKLIKAVNNQVDKAKQTIFTGKVMVEMTFYQGQMQRKIKCTKEKTINL